MQVLVVLPVYNEAENLKILIPKILALGEYIKILIVDDCSTDKSGELARIFQKENSERISIISHFMRLGRGAAIKKGYNFAIDNNFEFLIEMDSDLSHRPEDIPLLLNEASNVDIAIGSRLIKDEFICNRSFVRNLITFSGNIYLRYILGLRKIKDLTSGFRCINVKFLGRIHPDLLKSNGPQLLQEIVFKDRHKIRIKEVPIIFENRYRGKSKFNFSIIFGSIWLPLYWKIKDFCFLNYFFSKQTSVYII